jgi:hypothetical protein
VGERAIFSFTEHPEAAGCVRVRLVGEFDVAGAPGVQAVLRRLESEGSDVLLDLTGLSFIDALGMHVIEEAADAAGTRGALRRGLTAPFDPPATSSASIQFDVFSWDAHGGARPLGLTSAIPAARGSPPALAADERAGAQRSAGR